MSKNQCDGCNAGIPSVISINGTIIHNAPYPSGSMVCCADHYKEQCTCQDADEVCPACLSNLLNTAQHLTKPSPAPILRCDHGKRLKEECEECRKGR